MNSTIHTTWNLSQLIIREDDPELEKKHTEIEQQYAQFIKTWKRNKEYCRNPEILAGALKEYENLLRLYASDNTESYYYWLKSALEQDNAQVKGKIQTLENWSRDLHESIRFFEQSIAKIAKTKQKEFLKHPSLIPYAHFIERLFVDAKYLLTQKEERIMALTAKNAYANWVDMTESLLSLQEGKVLSEDGKEETYHFSQLLSLLDSQRKDVRDSAALAVNAIFKSQSYPIECEFNSVLSYKQLTDKLRKTKRPDELRHVSDDVESKVVDTMTRVVSSHYSLSQSFYALKAKLLGVSALEFHERNVSIGTIEKKYTFDAALHLVRDVFEKLDPEFSQILMDFATNGQIDVYPKKGKMSGAFCAHHLLIHPTFILLNFSGKLIDVTTLAHECGHGINNELMRKKQNSLNFDSPTSTAEVASTFMEDFVTEKLLEGVSEAEQLSILVSILDRDISTIFRQVAGYQFELELHEQYRKRGYLSSKDIGEIFLKHMKDYMGESVLQSPGSENWWMYWSHFRQFFYIYSYASGQLISKSLQDAVRKDHSAIESVKMFLQSGTSRSPRDIFLQCGIDIQKPEFWEAGIKSIETALNQAWKLAEKLGKI